MFHPIDGLTFDEKEAANVRVFEGDGTPYLRVAGLKSVESVRIGRTALPLVEMREVPADASLTRFHSVPVPMVDLQETAEGEQILLRSQLSNDGMWQAGQKIYIAGEWANAADAAPAKGKKAAE